jgi:hypothetical protein
VTTSAAIRGIETSKQQESIAPATFFRMSGLSLVIGCGLLAVGDIVRVVSGADPSNPILAIGWFLQAAGAMLAIVGIPGFAARHGAGTGVMGVVGIVGISVFLFLFGVFGGFLHAVAVPALMQQGVTKPIPVSITFFVAALFVLIGSLSLGIAAVRASALSRGTAALIMAGGLALFAGHPLGAHVEDLGLLLLMAGLGWAGYDVGFPRRPVRAEDPIGARPA